MEFDVLFGDTETNGVFARSSNRVGEKIEILFTNHDR